MAINGPLATAVSLPFQKDLLYFSFYESKTHDAKKEFHITRGMKFHLEANKKNKEEKKGGRGMQFGLILFDDLKRTFGSLTRVP